MALSIWNSKIRSLRQEKGHNFMVSSVRGMVQRRISGPFMPDVRLRQTKRTIQIDQMVSEEDFDVFAQIMFARKAQSCFTISNVDDIRSGMVKKVTKE